MTYDIFNLSSSQLVFHVAVVYFIFLIVMFVLVVVVTIVIQHLYLRAESVPFTPMSDWVCRKFLVATSTNVSKLHLF